MKKLLAWLSTNLDLTSDLVTLAIAAILIIRYQTLKPQPDISELLVGILAILSIIAISGFIEKRGRLTRMESLINESTELLENKVINRVKADDFLDRDQKINEHFFESANTIHILGITLGNTTLEFAYILGERLKAGADIKLMLISSEPQVVKQVILRSWGETPPNYYENRLESTIGLIDILGKTQGAKGSLELGLLPYVPSFGIIAVDPNDRGGMAVIELYHHNLREPMPSFSLAPNKDPYWFQFFINQFNVMWRQSSQRTILEKGGNTYLGGHK